MEAIEQGREARSMSPRLRLALVGVALAVVAIGATAWVIDDRWRDRTAAELTRAFDETVTAIESGERRVNSVVQYAGPEDTSAAQEATVRAAAVDAAASITAARDRVESITIPPWHSELLTAREEADTWLALRSTGITSLAAQGRAVYPPQGELDDARSALVGAFSALQ